MTSEYDVDLFGPMYDFGDDSNSKNRSPVQMDERVKSCMDALIMSVNKCSIVDMHFMEEVSGIPVDRLISVLRGKMIVQDPDEFMGGKEWNAYDGWILNCKYVYKNIRDKLGTAINAARRFPGCFEDNVRLLEENLPADVSLDDVNASLGATWIPDEFYAEFIKELLEFKEDVRVFYSDELASWKIIPPGEAVISVKNNMSYGTDDLSAVKISEQTMNARTVKVYDYKPLTHRNGFERTLNRPATLAVQEKQNSIIYEFDKWVRIEPYRKKLLEEHYNDVFAGIVGARFDGSLLEFPGLNPEVKFFDHQKNAVAHALFSDGNVLFAHDVGTGKTYEMVASVHELWRMGLSMKNLVVVPNNVLADIIAAHHYLYPDDKILEVYPKDFGPKTRNEVLARIRDEEFVAVYMAYSSFDMIKMSKEYYVRKMEAELRKLRTAAANASSREERHLLKVEAKRLSKKLVKFIEEDYDYFYIPYDELGITTLVCDEFHNYKNIPIETKTDNVVGMHVAGSKKCSEMLEKSDFTPKKIFATGTPLTNSLADLYVLMRFLQPEDLKLRGIDTFDMWINCFGERETAFEIDVDSTHLRTVTRFSSFHNLTELMSLFSTVCSFYHVDEKDNDLPDFNGYIDVTVPKSPAQAAYIANLATRTELIRNRKVKRTEDNLLLVTIDGRKCALDGRLVGLPDQGSSKISVCADKVSELYYKYPGTSQLVFSDIGTPKSSFNVYDCLFDELVKRGIKPEEIAYAHDAKNEKARLKMFEQINSAKIRVVIGSTATLGIGVNVQEKLVALHHLSVPWRPSDIVQREGRILRRGNTCPEVFIFRYVTEGSFDSYSWQILQNKQKFISSFLSGQCTEREMADIADTVLNYAEVKALAIGNKLIKDRVETSNRLERLKLASRQRQAQLLQLRTIVSNTPSVIKKHREQISAIAKDVKLYERTKAVIPDEERIAFGEELEMALAENILQKDDRMFDSFLGFDVILPSKMLSDRPYVYVCSENGIKYPVDMKGAKTLGYCQRIGNCLGGLEKRIQNLKQEIVTAEKRCSEAQRDLDEGNEYEPQIEELVDKLAQIDRQIEEDKE